MKKKIKRRDFLKLASGALVATGFSNIVRHNEIEPYVNMRTYEETQLLDFNSQVRDFKIEFKQEIIARTALFVKKKKYAYWKVNEEGTPCDEISVTGLEIIRSDSAQAVRPRLKHIIEMIMRQEPEDQITVMIKKYKKELRDLTPGELAANIGINNIQKYLGTGKPIKGTPWHVKGVYNYRMLLKLLEIDHKYEDIHEGIKSKVAYVKKNPFNVETITFQEWPTEFDTILQFDADTMIDKFFIKKIETLLKQGLINEASKQILEHQPIVEAALDKRKDYVSKFIFYDGVIDFSKGNYREAEKQFKKASAKARVYYFDYTRYVTSIRQYLIKSL